MFKGQKTLDIFPILFFSPCTLPLSLILLVLLVPPESHPRQQSCSVSPEDAAVAPHAALQSLPEKMARKLQENGGKIAEKMARKFKNDTTKTTFTVGRDSGGLAGE
jgi:hypothetical protein